MKEGKYISSKCVLVLVEAKDEGHWIAFSGSPSIQKSDAFKNPGKITVLSLLYILVLSDIWFDVNCMQSKLYAYRSAMPLIGKASIADCHCVAWLNFSSAFQILKESFKCPIESRWRLYLLGCHPFSLTTK